MDTNTGAVAPLSFNFQTHDVRMVMRNDEPIFVAQDVCEALGIGKYRDAVARLDEDEGCPVVVDTPGGPQTMAGLTEAGAWKLAFTSRTEQAKPFQRWLAHEVLPSIRRSGGYALPGQALPRPGQVEAVQLDRLWAENSALKDKLIAVLEGQLTQAQQAVTASSQSGLIRQKRKRAWTLEERAQLIALWNEGNNSTAIAIEMSRSIWSIKNQVSTLHREGVLKTTVKRQADLAGREPTHE